MPGGDPPGTANAAGGTHPTGMHSCFTYYVKTSQNYPPKTETWLPS